MKREFPLAKFVAKFLFQEAWLCPCYAPRYYELISEVFSFLMRSFDHDEQNASGTASQPKQQRYPK